MEIVRVCLFYFGIGIIAVTYRVLAVPPSALLIMTLSDLIRFE